MRNFAAFEYRDGNVVVYADEKRVAEIDFVVMHRTATRTIAKNLAIEPALDDNELHALTQELALPRRHR